MPTIERYQSIIDLLEERAGAEGDRELYVFLEADGQHRRLTYRGLRTRACALASTLRRSFGFAPGDRALLLYPAGLAFIEAFFGCLYAGVIAVPGPLPRRRRAIEPLAERSEHCRPTGVLTAASVEHQVKQQLATSPVLARLPVVAADVTDDSDVAEGWPEVSTVGPETVAFIQYTSGSTGQPNGVAVTHRNLLHNQGLIKQSFRHPDGSTVVGWLPMFHDMGLVGNLLQSLFIKGRGVFMAPTTFLQQPMRWLKAISDYQAYTSGGPNFAFDLCVSKHRADMSLDLSSWRVAFNGAEPVRAETIDRFTTTFAPHGFRRDAFLPCYGLAEATLIVAAPQSSQEPVITTWDERSIANGAVVDGTHSARRRLVSCGAVVGDQQLAIVDPTTGRRLGTREVGEIWVSGPSVARGYWDEAARTAEVFHADLDGIPYLRTGDQGFVADGHLYIVGRLREILNLFGRKFWANAIESVAEQAVGDPAARCAALVDHSGPLPRLVIVCERTPSSAAEHADLASRVRAAISRHFDLSTSVEFVPRGALPRTSSGKLRRDVAWDVVETSAAGVDAH